MSNTPSETEIDNLLCKHWPAYSIQAVLVKMWLREAIESAIAQWGTPQPVVREPLSEQDILDGLMTTPNSVLENCADAFEAGVRFAAHHHGITQKGGQHE